MKKALAVFLLSTAASAASAATILLTGTNFDVQYDDALTGLYGTPTISGNVIFFTPTTFKAESLNGIGIDTQNGTVNLTIIPKNGFVLGTLNLKEQGDYLLRGANSYVDVDGQTRARTITNPLMDTVAPILLTAPMTLRDGNNHNWEATSSLNLTNLGIQPNQTVIYTIENLLEAYTESSDIGPKRAFIEKKFSGFSVTVSPVPEPGAVISLLAGLGIIGFALRKKQGANTPGAQ
jgi:hypothetical protein